VPVGDDLLIEDWALAPRHPDEGAP
jgi:hypothetical protein